MKRIVELCKFCKLYLGILLVDGEPCCQFCAEELKNRSQRLIQMKPRVVHCKKEEFDVYIGRGSKWGNPFSHKEGTLAEHIVGSREEAIAKYEEYLLNNQELVDALPELKGKILGCWCKPKACHGDVLLKLANPSPKLF